MVKGIAIGLGGLAAAVIGVLAAFASSPGYLGVTVCGVLAAWAG